MSETSIGKKKVMKTEFHCYLVILCLCVISSLPAYSDAGDFIYETDFVSYTLSSNGMNKSLRV